MSSGRADPVRDGPVFAPGSKNLGYAVLNAAPCEAETTIAVTGLGRSGTTMIARVLEALGLPLGENLSSRFLEDPAILALVKENRLGGFEALCRERDQHHRKWAFKCPALRTRLAETRPLMRAPRYIVPFRDPMAVSQRNALSLGTDPIEALGLAMRGYTKLVTGLQALDAPVLALSYEKALQYPEEIVRVVAEFCGVDLTASAATAIAADVIGNGDERYFSPAGEDAEAGPMPETKILLIGNSHVQTIRAAAAGAEDLEIHWLKASPGARYGEIGIEAAEARIAALGPDDLLVLMQLGTVHNLIGLLNHERPFALAAAAGENGLPEGVEMIPERTMRAYLRDIFERDRILARLAGLARCRVVHVMPPPPKEDLDQLNLSGKVYRGHAVAEYGFSPAARRLALWRLEQEELSAFLAEIGVDALSPPPETRTAEGYLHPDFCAPDATHANAAYGARVLAQLRSG